MPLRRVGCVDINGVDNRFCLALRLRLPGLFLLILCAVILIVLGSKFCRYLDVEGGKFGFEHNKLRQYRRKVAALPVGASNSIVMGLHIFLESVSVCLEELFEDVVDHIADTARLALRRMMYYNDKKAVSKKLTA